MSKKTAKKTEKNTKNTVLLNPTVLSGTSSIHTSTAVKRATQALSTIIGYPGSRSRQRQCGCGGSKRNLELGFVPRAPSPTSFGGGSLERRGEASPHTSRIACGGSTVWSRCRLTVTAHDVGSRTAMRSAVIVSTTLFFDTWYSSNLENQLSGRKVYRRLPLSAIAETRDPLI